ncbi:MAG: hypothetical protein AAF394_01475 [Planctomycetota bacterium]
MLSWKGATSIALCLHLLAGLLAVGGCSRSKYRVAADQEAYQIIAQKNCDPRWTAPKFNIDVDARSRYFDPYRPDCSPAPRDDPSSHRYMHCVDGKEGWDQWEEFGTRAFLENPAWRSALSEYVPINESGALRLDLDSALKLAYVHSPNHQSQLETLYLAALDVSRERFRLDTQFFGGSSLNYNHNGGLGPAAIATSAVPGQSYQISGPFPGEQQTRLSLGRTGANPTLQARRSLASAGELIAGFANSFVIEFTGPNQGLHSSIASFALTQPLLQRAGRDVALEQLTFFERVMLANIRGYTQFRQGFYTQVAIGEAGVVGPQRRGSGTTLQIFGGQGGIGGYIGLLQQLQIKRNAEDNLNLQLRTLDQLETLLEADQIDLVQVDQFRQNVERDRASLLALTNNYENALDRYKTSTLGLPPDLPLEVDDGLIQQFQIVSREGTDLQSQIVELQKQIGTLSKLDADGEIIEPTEQEILDVLKVTIPKIEEVFPELEKLLEATVLDAERMEAAVPAREASMDEKQRKQFAEERRDLLEALEDLMGNYEKSRAAYAEILRLFEQARHPIRKKDGADGGLELDANDADKESDSAVDESDEQEESPAKPAVQEAAPVDAEGLLGALQFEKKSPTVDAKDRTVVLLRNLSRTTNGTILLQGRARLEKVTVEAVEMESLDAFYLALESRLDFMNGRAALVDDWRQIQIAADALQSALDLTINGNARTERNNPVSIDPRTSTLNLGLRFDAPFTRLIERNAYRESLISYQRSRRALIQSHDSLHLGLRVLLRELQRLRADLEIQRRAVAIAIRRVDVTVSALYAPGRRPQPGQRSAVFGPTATINLLSAQGALRDTQNSFLRVWLSYYAARMRLYRELGIMQLDGDGRWMESSLPQNAILDADGEQILLDNLPPAVPAEMAEAVEQLPQDFRFEVFPERYVGQSGKE